MLVSFIECAVSNIVVEERAFAFCVQIRCAVRGSSGIIPQRDKRARLTYAVAMKCSLGSNTQHAVQ